MLCLLLRQEIDYCLTSTVQLDKTYKDVYFNNINAIISEKRDKKERKSRTNW